MISSAFLGQLLILLLLLITVSQIFFTKRTRINSIVLFSPIAFIILLIHIIGWGFGFYEQILLCLCILVFVVNWRALIRFFNHLYIDSYNLSYIIFSSIALVCIVSVGVLLFSFRPVYLSPKKYQIQKDVTSYTNLPLMTKNLQVTRYKCAPEFLYKNNDIVLLFVPDKRACINSYDSYLTILAKMGYTVYAGDYRFNKVKNTCVNSIVDLFCVNQFKVRTKKEYLTQDVFRQIYANEFADLYKKVSEIENVKNKKIFLIADGIPSYSFIKVSQNQSIKIDGTFSFARIAEYKTNGYGFIEQSDPFFAKLRFDLGRDKTCFTPSLIAMKTDNAIKAMFQSEEK